VELVGAKWVRTIPIASMYTAVREYSFESCPDYKNKNMIITYIANTLFIIIILFIIWFVVCSIIYIDKPSNDLTGQSERQKRNNDYNNDYYP
jgi:hypothetical protein